METIGSVSGLEQDLLAWLEQRQGELQAFLAKLVSFDSQNFITHGNERPCAEYIQTVYEAMGLDTRLYSPDDVPGIQSHPGYLPGRGMANRPNVDGAWQGEDAERRVLVAAHIDTMPVGELASWATDPFGGEIRDGKLYGLGSGDNKSGIAAGVFALRALQAAGAAPKKTIVLSSYVDEEYGGGNGALGACLAHPYECIVNLDGGNYEVWTAALGGGCFAVDIACETPTDTAAPTVKALNKVLEALEAMGGNRRAELAQNPLYTGTDMERSAFRLMECRAGSAGSDLGLGHIGFAIYTDRDKAAIQAEFDAMEAELKTLLHSLGYRMTGIRPTTRWFDYGEIPADHPVVVRMKDCAQKAAGRPVPVAGACLSDLSVFQTYGSPASFNFGILRDFALPGGSHQPDEYVECGQLLQLTQALALFLLRHCC